MTKRKRQGTAEVLDGSDRHVNVGDRQLGWYVWAHFEFLDGAPRITELRLTPDPEEPAIPAGGITTTVIRKLSMTSLYDALGQFGDPSAVTLALRGLDPDENFMVVRRPGRRGRDDDLYVLWAQRYVTKCATSRRPYAELAEEHPGYSPRNIKDIVQTAKRRGLLVGGSQGRAGGTLTPKAKKLLAQMKGDSK